jgi:hypothetical protein
MGALIIENNELSDARPEAAWEIERAVEAAVAPHTGAFYGSVFTRGERIRISLREHTRAASAWEREISVPLAAAVEEVKRRVGHLLQIRSYVASRRQEMEDCTVMPWTEVSAWPALR